MYAWVLEGTLPLLLTTHVLYSSSLSRGLNPPHRVKSISMTTFTDAEVDTLTKGGNDVRLIPDALFHGKTHSHCLLGTKPTGSKPGLVGSLGPQAGP